MTHKNMLRFGLISFFTVALAGASVVACDGDDTADNDGNNSSSSGDAGTSGNGSSGNGSSGNGSSGNGSSGNGSSGNTPQPEPAALIMAHGYPAIGAVRVCYAVSPDAAPPATATPVPLAPLPKADSVPTGLIPGAGGLLPSTGTQLDAVYIRPFLVRADKIANPALTCADLIGESAPPATKLVAGTDYWALEPVPKGTFKADHSYALVAAPAADATPAAPKVQLKVFELDTATEVDAEKVGLQFIHASPAIQAAMAGAAPYVERQAGAAGAPVKEYLLGPDNATKVGALAPLTAIKEVAALDPAAEVALGVTVGPANVDLLSRNEEALVPISTWSGISDPMGSQKDADGSLYFRKGSAFTVILLGDPAAAGSGAAAVFAKPHFLVFPNKPIVVEL